MGDSSDNYQSFGIGPKTASNLINEFGSVDNIYKNISKLKAKNPKLAEKLEKAEITQSLLISSQQF